MKRSPGFIIVAVVGLIGLVSMLPAGIIQAIIPAAVPTPNRQGSTGTKFFICTGTFTTGNVITTDSNGNCIDGGATPVGGGLISYSSAGGLTLTANTYFFPLGGGGAPSTTATDTNTLVEPLATVSNLGVSISAAFGMGNTGVFTVRDITAASDSSITCTISGASAVSCSDTSDSFATVAGHFYAVKLVTTGTISVTPVVTFSLQFGSVGAAGVVGAATANQTAYYPATGTRISGGGPGMAGQCWTSNGPGSAPSFQACGGGGGGTSVTISTFAGIASCSTTVFLNIFNNALIDSAYCDGASNLTYYLDGRRVYPPEALYSFSWVNQGDATLTTTNGAGELFGGTASGLDSRIRSKSAPSTPYHIILGYKWRADGSGNSMSGLCFRDSSSGKVEIATLAFQGDLSRPVIFQLTNPTTFSATAYNPGTGTSAHSQGMYWLRIGDDGTTNRTFDFSENGYTWKQLFSEGRTSFLTADSVCYYVNGGNGVGDITAISWQETN